MKKSVLSCIFMVIALFILPMSAEAAVITVTGSGISEQTALDDAFRNGIEKAVGVLVESRTVVKNYQLIEDKIYTQARGFIQDYTVLNKLKDGDLFNLSVKLEVNTEPKSELYDLLQKLKLINYVLDNPRIAVMIEEKNLDQSDSYSVAEKSIINELKKSGFSRILETKKLLQFKDKETEKLAFMLNKSEGIDYLVIGEAKTELIGRVLESSLISCRSSLEANFIKADTGQVIAAENFISQGVDINKYLAGKKALSDVGRQMGEYMAKEVLNYASSGQQQVSFLVKNLLAFEKVTELERKLLAIAGVKGVHIREYKSGEAAVDIEYIGSLSGINAYLVHEGLSVLEKTSNLWVIDGSEI